MTKSPTTREKKRKPVKSRSIVIFALNDSDLIDQLPDAKMITKVQELTKYTYKITFKEIDL